MKRTNAPSDQTPIGIRFYITVTDPIMTMGVAHSVGQWLKVRESQNDFFKPTIPPKNKRTNSTLLVWNLK